MNKYLKAAGVGFGLSQAATLITTVYLHRVLSHKSIELHPAATTFMRFGTWMLTSISPREWVAVHRKHHNFSDEEGDPHSPHIEGYWKIMLANVYYYRREAENDDTMEKYAADLPFDKLDRVLLRRGTLGFSLTGVILAWIMGTKPGLVAWATLAATYLMLNAAINGAGHTFGEKSFENDATNLKLLALITFGEGLHNNHHARPAAPRFSAFKGEIDPAWPVIRAMEKVGLAKVLTKVDEGWENHRRRLPEPMKIRPGAGIEVAAMNSSKN
ncbi:MAG: fatty acid desaturase [Actinomycetota bacterium]|nr:fatty acid desaturase [Actinomycetota bacterium]